MYALFEKIDDQKTSNKKRLLVTRYQVPTEISLKRANFNRILLNNHVNEETKSTSEFSYKTNENKPIHRDHIVYVCFDNNFLLTREFMGPLRAINEYIQTESDSSTCLEFLKSTNDRIFFISTSTDKQFLKQIHECDSVEAIFILHTNFKIDRNRFPKLFGVYIHPEELLTAVRNTHEWFEQTQMDFFSFQGEDIFIWSQLWKEEFINTKNFHGTSNKKNLVNVAEKYYKGNIKLLDGIDDFDCFYNHTNALHWCFMAPFPSNFLHRALATRNVKFIEYCHFLINDVSNVLTRPTNIQLNYQLFRGMKVTNEILDKLVKHIGKLVCTKGFFTFTTSRTSAIELARSPNCRPDLRPVLFKISCVSSVPIGEIVQKDSSSLIVFDVYIAFRIKWVTYGPVTVVKLELADEDGRHVAQKYKNKFDKNDVQSLLNKLAVFSQPPPRLPPISRAGASPSRAALSRGAPSRAGQSGTGPSGAGSPRTGQSRTGPSGTGPSGTGPSGTGPSGTGSSRTGPSGTGSSRTGPSGTGSSRTGPSGTGLSGVEPSEALSMSPINMAQRIVQNKPDPPVLSKEEIHADNMAKRGQLDQALAMYANVKTRTPRLLNSIGLLYADKKGDYTSAAKYFREALKMQEERGEDVSETLIQIGTTYHNRQQFDKALNLHIRALNLRTSNPNSDYPSIASSLVGIANAQAGQENLSEALLNANRALAINQAVPSENDLNLSMNYAILAVIHHRMNDNHQALDFSHKALAHIQHYVNEDSLALAAILNNLGAIQLALDLFPEAQKSLNRAMRICRVTLKEGHPRRIVMETNIRRLQDIAKARAQQSRSNS